MDYDEVKRYLDVSLAHSIVVDVHEVPEAPGYVRTITIHDDNSVTIEFEKCSEYKGGGSESSGLKYVGEYQSLEDLVNDLEEYLGRPVTRWSNFTADPYEPQVLEEPDPQKNARYFENLVRERQMPLPGRGTFDLAGIYWRHIDLFGEYRPGRLGEETEIALRKRGIDPNDDEDG